MVARERFEVLPDLAGGWMVWDKQLDAPAIFSQITLDGLSAREAKSLTALLNAQWRALRVFRQAS
ncbi:MULTISPECIES: hypothetical protein [unclassified Mesorhizobium]|uniref:hypothetical protein n=1 Tax=unclassified Mesorhizobium TaxID=325217 RepID=UPI0007014008|nr:MULTISPECIES: hypothetical protein [unclassified Mesorhizobium]